MTYQLIHGDCLDVDWPQVNLIFADIPYNEVNRKSSGLRNLDKGIADSSVIDINKMLDKISASVTGSVYIFCGTEQVSSIRAGLVLRGFSTRLIIWEKTNPSPMNGDNIWLSGIECCVFGRLPKAVFNEHCKNTVLRFPTVHGKLHPTQKPVKLIEYIISVSTNEGDTVLDFCFGSCTTGVACINTGRNFIGIEKELKYFEIGQERMRLAQDAYCKN